MEKQTNAMCFYNARALTARCWDRRLPRKLLCQLAHYCGGKQVILSAKKMTNTWPNRSTSIHMKDCHKCTQTHTRGVGRDFEKTLKYQVFCHSSITLRSSETFQSCSQLLMPLSIRFALSNTLVLCDFYQQALSCSFSTFLKLPFLSPSLYLHNTRL